MGWLEGQLHMAGQAYAKLGMENENVLISLLKVSLFLLLFSTPSLPAQAVIWVYNLDIDTRVTTGKEGWRLKLTAVVSVSHTYKFICCEGWR